LNRILVLFAHPAMEKSRVNRVLADAVRDVEGVTFHDLYEAYPRFDIDVPREQELLLAHDVYVFQHPFYWYSTPAILKEWQDLVLEHGWAYGREGTALRGKTLLNALTAGGRASAYRRDGLNRYSIREFLRPIEQTARLCGMEYLPPFAVPGTHSLATGDIPTHSRDYRRLLEALRDDRLDRGKIDRHEFLNSDLEDLVQGEA
jgi:glutathione-regulated potassium-efflux system ancillary protein KefG